MSPTPLTALALALAAQTLAGRPGGAQDAAGGPPLTSSDSALIELILVAEASRDSLSSALAGAAAHRHPAVRALAARARARIVDPAFAGRAELLGAAAAPRVWPEPDWKPRHRAVLPARDDCALLRRAAADSAWPVRQRAAAMARASCAGDDSLAAVFRAWAEALPADASRREFGGLSWQPASHGLVAFARLKGAAARPLVARHARHGQWQVRQYAARAAAPAGDVATLRRLARDPDENVAEAAIEWLSATTGHADDSLYVATLTRDGVPSVRAAAVALRGTAHPGAAPAALAAFERFAARANASERDVRTALLHVAGRAASEDRAPPRDPAVPREAVGLALGAVRYLRVELDEASGGGSFVVVLRGDVAPLMAARVLTLAREGYYDGTSWHRVEHDFVIQGGSPGANEYVGYRQYLVDELGTVPHQRGTVGMSTRGHDTGDAQWFVNLRDNPRLAADYTVFAAVVEGMETVDGIVEGDRIARVREVRR
jgi:cyclophilin family peptidyl-prolyl cis-trans isomerase